MLARLASGSPCGTARTRSSWPISTRVSLAGSVGQSMKAMSSWASAAALASTEAASWLSRMVTPGWARRKPASKAGRSITPRVWIAPDVQLAAQDAADTGHGIAALVGCGERAAGRRQQRAAGLSEHHVPAVAHEQRGAHLVLERADGRAQAGLDDVDPGRGPGEVQLLGNRDEVGQLPKLHQSMLSMMISESKCWTDARISRTLKEHHPQCVKGAPGPCPRH